MYLKSMFPDIPPVGDANIHDFIFGRPPRKDFTLYIDAATGRRRSYHEFVQRVYDGATALGTPVSDGGLGLRAENGEMVGILSENCIDYVALEHSLLAITVPFVLLSAFYTPFELDHALRLSKITRLFVHPSLLPMALNAASKVGLSERNIYILEGATSGRTSFGDMVDGVRINRLPRLPVRPATRDTMAYMVFSSGTSGLPKAVMLSHGNVFATLNQRIVVTEEASKVYTPPPFNTPEGLDVSLAFLPFHHSYALYVFCLRPLYTIVILPKWNIERAIKAIEKYQVTRLFMIPSLIHQLVNYPKLQEADLSSLLFIGSGAAYFPLELAERLSAIVPKDIGFSQGYGLSEATFSVTVGVTAGILGGRAKVNRSSIGILMPGLDARILRDDGSDTDVNEPGELWLKGNSIALGYWNNEKANKETFVDGWLRTGDRVRVDECGSLFFEDRAKDTLKVSGVQVSPAEIEDTLLAQPDKFITDIVVAGVSGGRTLDEKIPRAWIVLSSTGKRFGSVTVVKALEAWCKQNLSKYKWLRGGIEVVDEIPKSPTGKVLRRVLQDKYESQIQQQARSKL